MWSQTLENEIRNHLRSKSIDSFQKRLPCSIETTIVCLTQLNGIKPFNKINDCFRGHTCGSLFDDAVLWSSRRASWTCFSSSSWASTAFRAELQSSVLACNNLKYVFLNLYLILLRLEPYRKISVRFVKSNLETHMKTSTNRPVRRNRTTIFGTA